MKPRCSKALLERVKAACEKDPNIVVAADALASTQGYAQSYLEHLGLSKADLKRLASVGLAVRAYTKNIWLPGEIMPSGSPAPGNFAQIPWASKSTYVDARGYTRTKRKIEMIEAPNSTMRGKGHSVRWVLIGQE